MSPGKLPPRGYVRVRRTGNQSGYIVSIPAEIGRKIGTEALFRVELVDEGILLRYVKDGQPVKLPKWLRA